MTDCIQGNDKKNDSKRDERTGVVMSAPNRRATAVTLVSSESAPPSQLGQFVMYPMRTQGAPARSAATLGDYLDAIYRRRWWILCLVFAAVTAAYLLSRRLPRVYESTATLNVDRVAPAGLVGPDTGTQVAPDMDQFVATHVKMLQSDAVLRPVADKFKLLIPNTRTGKPEKDDGPIRLPGLHVSRPPNTYLIQISYRSRDPQSAAAVANWVAKSYIDHLQHLRENDWTKLSGATKRQLEDLKEKMERSNESLLEFQRKIGMVDPEDKTNVLTARLLQLNTDFARAQSDRGAKEAAYQMLRSGNAEAAEASTQGEQLKRLLERKSELQQKFSDVKAIYAENHPEYLRALAQVHDVDSQLTQAYSKAVKRAEAELKEARLREANLNATYLITKAEADTVAAHSVEYRLQRQRADADRTMFEELSRKVGEAEINSGLRGTPVRIADAARPDARPASPNVPLNCGIALLGSLVLGCVGSIAYETRNQKLRTVDEVRAVAGAQLVATLPTVRLWRGRRGSSMFAAQIREGKPGTTEIPRFREKIRMLRNELAEHTAPPRVRVIAVMSPGAGEGRTRISAELATAYAVLGRRTLLIDANLRNPVLHALQYAPASRTGLSTALSGETRWRDGIMHAPESKLPDLLPAGAPDPRSWDLLHQRLQSLVDETIAEYEIVILDTPPFLKFSESLDIVRSADIVIAVVRSGASNPREFETMLRYLQRMDARVGAVVLNDAGNV